MHLIETLISAAAVIGAALIGRHRHQGGNATPAPEERAVEPAEVEVEAGPETPCARGERPRRWWRRSVTPGRRD